VRDFLAASVAALYRAASALIGSVLSVVMLRRLARARFAVN
jgi:hypothetical protein